MKWILLVYIAVHTPLADGYRERRLEFPMDIYAKCELMSRHINHIESYGHNSGFPFVRSLYWVHVNMSSKVLARCIYADPNNIPDWADDFLK